MLQLPFGRQSDLAIDLGSAAARAVVRGRSDVYTVPSAVAIAVAARGREVVAVGEEARKMLGKTPAGTEVVRPVRGGVVADFEATEAVIRKLLEVAGARTLLRPRVLVCVPSSHTEVERRAVQESVRAAGGRDVLLVTSSMAAAIGAGLPVDRPIGNLVVDLGAGRIEAMVSSLGGVVLARDALAGGDAMDAAIGRYLQEEHRLLVGERTCEVVKERVGCATPIDPPLTTRIRGRDLDQGTPREVDLLSDEMATALADIVGRIRDVVLGVLADTPPELASDIIDRGVLLCGGVARLRGLDAVLRDATGLPVLVADHPEECVARGALKILEDSALFDRVVMAQ
jgi:rod shape-determining protein MreB